MTYNFNLAYPYIFICLVLILLLAAVYRWFFWRADYYQSALTGVLINQKIAFNRYYSQNINFFLRILILSVLILAAARLQYVDPKSKIPVRGVDMMLVLDVSQSMELADNINDLVPRIEIAKKEAINFVNKRENDSIGVVLFGKYAFLRCPLTLDKITLRQIINQIEIGSIDPNGTCLAVGMLTAINRLRKSQAKSRIMIVLTDGQPSPGDLDPQVVINLAQKLGIKIYTIGIGSENGGFFQHPLFGLIRQGEVFDHKLLTQIAQATGGQAFLAQNADDMQKIYNQIDQLETTPSKSPIFSKKTEFFTSLIILALILMILELFFAYFIWFTLI